MLGVTLGDLFAASDAIDVAVVRAEIRPNFRSSWSKARIEALMPLSAGRSLEAMMVTLEPGGTSGKRPAPGTLDQLAVIFDGRLMLTLSDEDLELDRGDAVLIHARAARQWRNTTLVPAQVLIVSARPR
jgi:quercetin dioxygenase-like cupin family protein